MSVPAVWTRAAFWLRRPFAWNRLAHRNNLHRCCLGLACHRHQSLFIRSNSTVSTDTEPDTAIGTTSPTLAGPTEPSSSVAVGASEPGSVTALRSFLDSLPVQNPNSSDASTTDPWSTVQYEDIIVLRNTKNGLRRLAGPLKPDGQFSNETGFINHSDLVGLRARDRVVNHKGHGFTVHFPTLEEYVLLAPRAATPIYPKDVSAILSMLDLPRPNARILEAGTGTGGLTVHLASVVASTLGAGRILSVDMRKSHSTHAAKFLTRVRRGQLRPYVDFVTGDLSQVLATSAVPDSTFDGAVLDLLNPWDQVGHVYRVMKPDAHLVVYAPNVTQAIKVLETIKKERLGLALVRCVEVSEREWEIKPAVIKWPEGKVPKEQQADLAESWMCRPKHQQTGHTAFLLHMTCTKPGSERAVVADGD